MWKRAPNSERQQLRIRLLDARRTVRTRRSAEPTADLAGASRLRLRRAVRARRSALRGTRRLLGPRHALLKQLFEVLPRRCVRRQVVSRARRRTHPAGRGVAAPRRNGAAARHAAEGIHRRHMRRALRVRCGFGASARPDTRAADFGEIRERSGRRSLVDGMRLEPRGRRSLLCVAYAQTNLHALPGTRAS